MRLVQLAQKKKPKSFRVSSAEEISKENLDSLGIETMGITAGASSPQILIDEIIEKIKTFYPNIEVMNFPGSREDSMNFKLPKELLK
jgi:4-hydroxy-3-methylbut-2-enyl diphosphate reductase